MKIFKYKLEVKDQQIIGLPYKHKILHFGFQKEVLYFWALVDEEAVEKTNKQFFIFGTGNPLPKGIDKLKHLATVLQETDFISTMVWHIFED